MLNTNKKNSDIPFISRFPCNQCGALLTYKPGTQRQACQYCGQENEIESKIDVVQEYDLHHALTLLARAKPVSAVQQITCEVCGAGFKFAESVHAGTCPFCGTDIIAEITDARPISPKSLLPFNIDEQEAKKQFKSWLKKLWFVPQKIKKYADAEASFQGIYIPYWTYDSHTETLYQGARGKIQYISESVRTYKGRHSVWSTREIPKVDWTPVQGKVPRFFDDLLVGADKSLPRQILEQLEPWDLENLVPYNESYLSGFTSKFYEVGIDEGFDEAKHKMDLLIYHEIANDIGGDEQRIDRFHTQHHDTTYKHCLLPVWSAAYRYRNKTYRVIINGRTGKVQGERPYSKRKIYLVLAGILLLVGFFMLVEVDVEPDDSYDDQSSSELMSPRP
jgi:predicted RNA-binding Zn-ribbon protein involved in translation (DUF1610 family)